MSKLIPNFTPIPNYYLDEIFPLLHPDQLQIMLYAARRIMGFEACREAQRDRISLSQFQEATMLSRPRASKAVKFLIDVNLLIDHTGSGPVSKQGREIGLELDDQKIDLDAIIEAYEKRTKKRAERARNFAKSERTGTKVVPEQAFDSIGTKVVPNGHSNGTKVVPITGTKVVPVSININKGDKETPQTPQQEKTLSAGRAAALNVVRELCDDDFETAKSIWLAAVLFEGQTGIDRPGFSELDEREQTRREAEDWLTNWVKPLYRLYQKLGDDLEVMIGQAIDHFRQESLSYGSPRSLEKTISRWAKDRELGHISGNGNGQHVPNTGESGGAAYMPGTQALSEWTA